MMNLTKLVYNLESYSNFFPIRLISMQRVGPTIFSRVRDNMTGDTVLVIAFNDVICCIKRYCIIYLCIVMGPGLSLTFGKGLRF